MNVDNRNLAIVMGRNYASRLGMVRAAGKAGYDVAIIQTNRKKSSINKIDASSQYVVDYVTSIEPERDDLLQCILKYKDITPKPILLPTDDYTASVIDLCMDELRENFLMPHVAHKQAAIIHLMNKANTKKMAMEAGFKVAGGTVAKYVGNSFSIPDDVKYPCFVKPKESYKRPLKNLMKKCRDREELDAQLHKISEISHDDILIESYIKIDKEYAVLGVVLDNVTVVPAVITMKEGYLGVTAIGEVLPISSLAGIKQKISDFFRGQHFVGLFDIDLFESDGIIYFNELNARLGASGYAITHSIVNLPEMLMSHLRGDLPEINYEEDFSPFRFANEKTCLAKYLSGQWSFSHYKKILGTSDVSFIEDLEDALPFKHFKRKEHLGRGKKVIKNIVSLKFVHR